jgi:hypothetical protein
MSKSDNTGTTAIAETVPRATMLKLGKLAPVSTNSGRRFQKHWFLNRTDDLSVVTNESSNAVLGILDIQIQAPTENQKNNGIICRVTLESTTGWDYGITIWETRENKDDIMLMVGGARDSGRRDSKGKKDYIRDRKLNDATTAQILSYVYKHLTIKEKEEN